MTQQSFTFKNHPLAQKAMEEAQASPVFGVYAHYKDSALPLRLRAAEIIDQYVTTAPARKEALIAGVMLGLGGHMPPPEKDALTKRKDIAEVYNRQVAHVFKDSFNKSARMNKAVLALALKIADLEKVIRDVRAGRGDDILDNAADLHRRCLEEKYAPLVMQSGDMALNNLYIETYARLQETFTSREVKVQAYRNAPSA